MTDLRAHLEELDKDGCREYAASEFHAAMDLLRESEKRSEVFANGYAERAISDDLVAALKEAKCWIPDGERNSTPEKRGAKKETVFGVEEMIDSAIDRAEGR